MSGLSEMSGCKSRTWKMRMTAVESLFLRLVGDWKIERFMRSLRELRMLKWVRSRPLEGEEPIHRQGQPKSGITKWHSKPL
jgi:hypothetical protein